MTEIKVDGIDGNFKHLNSTPPPGAKLPASVMTTEVTIENNPQPLRTIKPYTQSQLSIPSMLPSEARIVMHLLFECFANKGEVKEGLIGDILWGFNQSGAASELTYNGLDQLSKAGYLKFQAPDQTYIDLGSTAAEKAFVRYQPKLLDMVYNG